MHIAFAICFFIFVGLRETLRHGVLGFSPSEISTICYAALAVFALFILRSDIVYIVRRPRHALYGHAGLNWTWMRTALGLLLAPLLVGLTVLSGYSMIQIKVQPFVPDLLVEALLAPVLVISLVETLFFREAVMKAFQGDAVAIFVASGLAVFIYHVPSGLETAMMAAGAGLYFTALRLIGTNILVVALIQAATAVALTQVLVLVPNEEEMWRYATYFTVACAALSFTVFSLFTRTRREPQYA